MHLASRNVAIVEVVLTLTPSRFIGQLQVNLVAFCSCLSGEAPILQSIVGRLVGLRDPFGRSFSDSEAEAVGSNHRPATHPHVLGGFCWPSEIRNEIHTYDIYV